MTSSASDQGISNVTALRCGACGHEWPEICELPMPVEAWLQRARAWCICPKCGNTSNARGKAVLMLTDHLYRQAVDRFVAEGRVPANIDRPWIKT